MTTIEYFGVLLGITTILFFGRIDTPIREQGSTMKGIAISDDVWIGAGCRILDGVEIGKGSIIGAGTVLTKSVPEYSIVVGIPGKVIKRRKN